MIGSLIQGPQNRTPEKCFETPRSPRGELQEGGEFRADQAGPKQQKSSESSHLERQLPIICGYFVLVMGHFGVHWRVVPGYFGGTIPYYFGPLGFPCRALQSEATSSAEGCTPSDCLPRRVLEKAGAS